MLKQLLIGAACAVATYMMHTVTLAQDDPLLIWRAYREAHPLHVQEIAISAPNNEGSRTLIISEPPPAFNFAPNDIDIVLEKAFGPNSIEGVSLQKHPVMLDGWARDIVARVQSPNDAQLDEAVSWLSWYLYGDTHKAYFRDLSEDIPSPVNQAPENRPVSPVELRQWLLEEAAPLEDTSGVAFPLAQRFAVGDRGVFRMAGGELVVWLLDRKAAFGDNGTRGNTPSAQQDFEMMGEFRRFALESDLILGAIRQKNGDTIAVIGRGRRATFDQLPPLRYETLRTLAAAAKNSDQLGQSYERTHSFAGKLTSGPYENWDWAPIYLSDALQDTEFGSLLNMTDQLLKSWSLAGDIEYYNFSYPKPSVFPFDGNRLDKKVHEVSPLATGVLFNWNTAGGSRVLVYDDYEIASPLETGALPITYGSDVAGDARATAELEAFEEQGWTYFRERRDSNLTRVVQYTFLFQTFRMWGVTASDVTDVKTLPARRVNDALIGLALGAYEKLEKGEFPTTLSMPDFGDSSESDGTVELLKMLLESRLEVAALELGEIRRLNSELPDAIVKAIGAPRESLPVNIDHLAAELVTLLGTASKDDEDAVTKLGDALSQSEDLRKLFAAQSAKDIGSLLLLYSEPEVARASVVKAAYGDGDVATGHIKTPSVVLSRDVSPAGTSTVGGHSLDAAIPRIVVDPAVERGSPRLSADGSTIRINPEDVTRADDLGRAAARGKPLAAALVEKKPRSLLEAIGGEQLSTGESASLRLATEKATQEVYETARNRGIALSDVHNDPAMFIITRGSPDGPPYAITSGRPPSARLYGTHAELVERLQRDVSSRKRGMRLAFGSEMQFREIDPIVRSADRREADALEAAARSGVNRGGEPPRYILFGEPLDSNRRPPLKIASISKEPWWPDLQVSFPAGSIPKIQERVVTDAVARSELSPLIIDNDYHLAAHYIVELPVHSRANALERMTLKIFRFFRGDRPTGPDRMPLYFDDAVSQQISASGGTGDISVEHLLKLFRDKTLDEGGDPAIYMMLEPRNGDPAIYSENANRKEARQG